MSLDYAQFAIVVAGMLLLVGAGGTWLTRVLTSPHHGSPERLTYRLLSVDPGEAMGWKRYGLALLLSNAAMLLLGYLLLRIQGLLPFDSLQRAAQTHCFQFVRPQSVQHAAGQRHDPVNDLADTARTADDAGQYAARRALQGEP